jgi:centromere/kinetochore protein ZW10
MEKESWTALDDVGVSKTTRVMKLLDLRAFELKSDIHQVFDHVWKTLVQIDTDSGQVAIYKTREGPPCNFYIHPSYSLWATFAYNRQMKK